MDYRATNIEGTRYVRANEIVINNSYGHVPSILFNEEVVLRVGGQVLRQPYTAPLPAKPLIENFADVQGRFDLLDPDSGDVIGSACNADIRTLLYSKYRHLAMLRDQELAAAEQRQQAQAAADQLADEQSLQPEAQAASAEQ